MRQDYPKIFTRLSGLFNALAAVSTIFVLVNIVLIVRASEREAMISLGGSIIASALGALVFYTARTVINFFLDLHERIAYMERIQQQQNKMLVKIYDQQKGEVETEIA